MNKVELAQIFIYPIKGCKGISLTKAEVQNRGLKFDRRLMLIDESGTFVSQRSDEKLALISCKIEGDSLVVSFQGRSISIPLVKVFKKSVQTTVWDDAVMAYLTDEIYHQWFSGVLGRPVRLVAMQEGSSRPVDHRFMKSDQDEVSFADGYPYLIIGNSSLDLLNQKIAGNTKFLIDRFRPNLVFSGGEAHEEDTWSEFSIGDTTFYGVKPCARCQVTTINQQTGNKGKEPLKTLSGYRKHGQKILFGQNCLRKSGSFVKVGDQIKIHSYMKSKVSLESQQ